MVDELPAMVSAPPYLQLRHLEVMKPQLFLNCSHLRGADLQQHCPLLSTCGGAPPEVIPHDQAEISCGWRRWKRSLNSVTPSRCVSAILILGPG